MADPLPAGLTARRGDELVRSPGTLLRVLFFVAAVGGGALLLTEGFPPGSPDRLPVLVAAVSLALVAAASPARGVILFSFVVPCAGLLSRAGGGSDPVTWPGVLFAGLAAGWTFRFIYDFESRPDPSRADRVLRALLAIWTLATLVAAGRALTFWAAVRGLRGRAVNGDRLSDAAALRESLFAFAALAGGALFYFMLRRSGEAVRRRALAAAVWGGGVSALAAVLQRAGALPGELRPFWRMTGRLSGGAVDPNSLGLVCALLMPVALVAAARRGRSRVFSAALFLVLAAGLFLSGSRSGFLILLGTLAVLLVARAIAPRARIGALAALAAVVAGGALLAIHGGPGTLGERLLQSFDPALPVEYRVSARPVLWRAAGRLFLRHPIEGAGMGAFSWRLPDLLREDGRSLPQRDNPGSGYVQALAETGIAGFLATVAAAAALAAQAWRRARLPGEDPLPAAAGVAVLAFLAALATGSHWLAPDAALLFFLLAAAGGLPRSPDPRRGTARALSLLVAAYAVAALVAILATRTPEEAFRFSHRIGFHELEVGPGGPFRWTRQRFALWLTPGETVRLGLANFSPAGKPIALEARSFAGPVLRRTLAPGEAVALRLVGGTAPGPIRFSLDRSVVPKRLGVGADRRRLGLLSTSSDDPGGAVAR
ncbi:MAG: O-antigen ligase family protein [Acidobacteriota bacterium]